MIHLIVGKKGTGKTKKLVELINKAAGESNGSVVCIEQGRGLTYDISHMVRLVDADEYAVNGYDALYGFLSGVLAGNYDITHMFVDHVLRIGNGTMEEFEAFLLRLQALKALQGVDVVFSVSADASELPEAARSLI